MVYRIDYKTAAAQTAAAYAHARDFRDMMISAVRADVKQTYEMMAITEQEDAAFYSRRVRRMMGIE